MALLLPFLLLTIIPCAHTQDALSAEDLQNLAQLAKAFRANTDGTPTTVQADHGKIAFTKIGETSYRTEYITVSIDMDTNRLITELYMIRTNTLKTMKQPLNGASTDLAIETWLKQCFHRINVLFIKADLTLSVMIPWTPLDTNTTANSLDRPTRSVVADFLSNLAGEVPFGRLAWWGAKKVVGSVFGWLTGKELFTGNTEARDNKRSLKVLGANIDALSHRTERAAAAVKSLLATTWSEQRLRERASTVALINAAVGNLEVRWASHEAAVNAAVVGKLAIQALEQRAYHTIAEIVTREAAARELVPTINSLAEFLQCTTSFIVVNTDIHLLVHVPAAPAASLLEIYTFNPLPIPLEGGVVATPRMHHNTLAISHDNQIFTTLTTTDLLRCRQQGLYYLCPTLNVVRKPQPVADQHQHIDEGLCLYSLYTHDLRGALRVCPITLAHAPDEVRQVNKGNFVVFSSTNQYGTLDCEVAGERQRGEFRMEEGKATDIDVPAGCVASTDTHKFANPADGRSTEWENTRTYETAAIPAPEDINSETLQDIQDAAETLLGTHADLSVSQYLEVEQQLQEIAEQTYTRFALIAFAGALVLIALAATCYWRRRIYATMCTSKTPCSRSLEHGQVVPYPAGKQPSAPPPQYHQQLPLNPYSAVADSLAPFRQC
jgi:hypothetical protein